MGDQDTTITKVDSRFSPHGAPGEKYLASGKHVGMRLWHEKPGADKPATSREYETVGFVISGTTAAYSRRARRFRLDRAALRTFRRCPRNAWGAEPQGFPAAMRGFYRSNAPLGVPRRRNAGAPLPRRVVLFLHLRP